MEFLKCLAFTEDAQVNLLILLKTHRVENLECFLLVSAFILYLSAILTSLGCLSSVSLAMLMTLSLDTVTDDPEDDPVDDPDLVFLELLSAL